MKHLEIILTKDMTDSYTENYKTLLRETKDANEWRAVSCFWIGSILLCQFFPN